MRIASVFRHVVLLVIAVTAIVGTASVVSPQAASAAPGSLTQVATASIVSSSTLAMSGTASCTGGGTDSIQTVVVSQGLLTVGAIGSTSNEFPCDGNMYPWGIQEETTLGSWTGGSNVTSVVAFSSSLLSTNMATLTPASGTTLYAIDNGSSVDTTTARVFGTATCTGGGTKTIQVEYNEYEAGVSASGSTTVSCDGSPHNWGAFIYTTTEWSGELGTAVITLQNSSNQTIATFTTLMGFAA